MRRRLTSVFVLLMAFSLMASSASAGDLVWERFMRNNHDVLAIGEIVELTGEMCVIAVESTVVSARGNRRQLKPDVIQLAIDEEADTVTQYIGNKGARRQVGDYVLVAADKVKKDALFSGYMYKVDGLDKETLSLDVSRDASASFLLEVAMIEDFIRSDGQNTEFGIRTSKDGKTKQALRYADKTRRARDATVILEIDAPQVVILP